MRRSTFLLVALLAIASTVQADPFRGQHLKIVTLPNTPFVIDDSNRFEGYLIDVIRLLRDNLGFNYTISLPEDQQYGAFNPYSGKWNGMVGELMDGKVDLAIADLTITDERRAVVDFTAPFMITGISIIYKKSGVLPFNNVEELFKLNGTVPYGAMLEGSTIKFFRESKNPMYKHMYEWMTENIDNMMMSYSDALDRVSEGNFAFFMESPLVDYYRGKHCDLVRVGGLLDQKTYAFAGQKNSPYISPLNEAIVELVNSGKLHELYRKWWKSDPIQCKHLRIVTLPNTPFVIDEGNGQFEGYLIDLVRLLRDNLGFNYNISLPEDQHYGAFNPYSGNWNGLVGELVDGKADLAVADLTINNERWAVVDFTAPFMITGISIIYKKSGELPFNNVEELFNLNGTIPYGAMLEGSTIKFFRESKNPMYKHMYEWMMENIDNMMMSYSDALERVSKGNFAFFMELPLVDYYSGKYCDLVRVGGLLNQRAYGFAGQKKSPYIQPLNEVIVELMNNGKLHELYQKWWKGNKPCPRN